MILKRFIAANVHGYLNFDIEFKDDLNFLYGHNGCGKTTALNIIDGILTADIEKIQSIPFDSATVEFRIHQSEIIYSIRVVKTNNTIKITANTPTRINDTEKSIEIENLKNIGRNISPSEHKFLEDISRLQKPIFVTLDRKSNFEKKSFSVQSRPWIRELDLLDEDNEDSILGQVKRLISYHQQFVDKRTLIENEKIKQRILVDAFSVTDVNSNFDINNLPKIEDIEEKKKIIYNSIGDLNLDSKTTEAIKAETIKFFEDLSQKIKKLNDMKGGKNKNEHVHIEALTFVFINSAQINRINRIVDFIKELNESKKKLNEKSALFEEIINSFFSQTGKIISITKGKLKIEVQGTPIEVSSLSSGETQIITMFAHLIFDRKVNNKGCFIIDEPELSLHLAWQEMFVSQIQRASPSLQLIFATHSPAIINGKDSFCVPISKSLV